MVANAREMARMRRAKTLSMAHSSSHTSFFRKLKHIGLSFPLGNSVILYDVPLGVIRSIKHVITIWIDALPLLLGGMRDLVSHEVLMVLERFSTFITDFMPSVLLVLVMRVEMTAVLGQRKFNRHCRRIVNIP